MAVFDRQKKGWKLNSLKPLDQAKKEAENPEKYGSGGYRKPKAKKSEMTKNTPKDRLAIAHEVAEEKAKKEGPNEKAERERAREEKLKAFEEERKEAARRNRGSEDKFKDRPRQRNEPKLEFFMDPDTHKEYVILEVAVPKFLDTSAIDIDIQPTWVAIAIKTKEFLIHTPCEINMDSCKAERSQGTGALVLTMPKLGEILLAHKNPEMEDRPTNLNTVTHDKKAKEEKAKRDEASRDLTDSAIGKTTATVNLNVLEASEEERAAARQTRQDELAEQWAPKMKASSKVPEKALSPNFVDNPDCPPLE